jgi:hypothetical protein
MKARAKLMASGLETELSVVVDVFFPTAVISAAAKAFASRFPLTPLRLFVDGLGAAYQPVLDGRRSFGILATIPVPFPSLVSERLGEVPLVAAGRLCRCCCLHAQCRQDSSRRVRAQRTD